MTRTSDEWRERATENVEVTLDDVIEAADEMHDDVVDEAGALRALLLVCDAERAEQRDAIEAMEETLVERAHGLLDQAQAVRKLRDGPTLRNLEGKEPVGYSKRDGGVAHDALYGGRAQASNYARKIRWPLRLDEWDVEKAERRSEPPGYEPVAATGVKKYTRRAGGRTVHVVLGPTDPPI